MDDEITAEIPAVRPVARGGPAGAGRPAFAGGRTPPRGTPRWLMRAIVAVAVLAVLLGAADVALLVSGHHPAAPPPARHAGGGDGTPPTTGKTTTTVPPPTTVAPATSTTTAGSTTTTTVAAVSGTGPVLTSVSPAAGGPGSVVVVHGQRLFSPASGVVVARVDGATAPTDCTTQTSCQVTIPQLSRPPSTVTVTVTTDAGTSNAVPFRYS